MTKEARLHNAGKTISSTNGNVVIDTKNKEVTTKKKRDVVMRKLGERV